MLSHNSSYLARKGGLLLSFPHEGGDGQSGLLKVMPLEVVEQSLGPPEPIILPLYHPTPLEIDAYVCLEHWEIILAMVVVTSSQRET